MADIWLSTENRSEVYKLPLLPPEFPEINIPKKNEEFESFNSGNYNLSGNVGLNTFTLEGTLPSKGWKYSFCRSGYSYLEILSLFNRSFAEEFPIRITMLKNDESEYYNGLVKIENLSYKMKKNGDYTYKVDFKQYRKIDVNNLGVR